MTSMLGTSGKKRMGDLERETGVEPATSSLGSLRSTPELLPLPILRAEGSHGWSLTS